MGARVRRPLERSRKIGSQILEGLDPDGEPDEAVCQTCLQACGRIHCRVSHGRGMGDETLDAAERLRQREASQVGTEGSDRLVSSRVTMAP